jgi:hypothetical protein
VCKVKFQDIKQNITEKSYKGYSNINGNNSFFDLGLGLVIHGV